jgi:lipopolysaccharide biosynthesis protein
MKTVLIEYKFYSDEEDNSFFFNEQLKDHIYKRILITNREQKNKCDRTVILNHTNQGKDIGAKLTGIDFLLSTNEEFDVLVFLHDKKSPHSPLGNYWNFELKKIISDKYFPLFNKSLQDPDVGICCAANYIKSEYVKSTGLFETTNNFFLKELIDKYNLTAAAPYQFVAGTIFGCKWAPIKNFFCKNPPLKIRATLEKGNVQDTTEGTLTHSWERIFSWIITSQGYSLRGI